MNQFLEAAGIALNAIWSNKLRSLLTVLGNIVAVTSIIAVVSLIQGMNGYVTDTIVSGVGADSFTIQRQPAVRTQEDEDRVRSFPRITVDDAKAVRKFSDNITAVAAQGNASARVIYGEESLDIDSGARRLEGLPLLPDLRRRVRPPHQLDRDRSQPAGHGARRPDRRAAVRPAPADRQSHQDRRPELPRRRRQREEGLLLRPVAGRVRPHPAWRVPEDVRVAPEHPAAGQADARPISSSRQWTMRRWRFGSSAG